MSLQIFTSANRLPSFSQTQTNIKQTSTQQKLKRKKNLSFTEGKYQVQENESGITRTMLERGLWVEGGGRGLQ